LQALELEPLDIDESVDDAPFKAKIVRAVAAIAPTLDRTFGDPEPLGELLLVQMADLGCSRPADTGTIGFPTHGALSPPYAGVRSFGRNRALAVDRESGETVDGFRFVDGFRRTVQA
jgi:hypothetical protein